MSGEIVVPETPNWLNDLEAKRERRLKARLGHEAGAGAPCLKCGDKCPGLDLHFWRKACKICRCPKEDHDVPDDDIYGWAQFQLLGSKPNKIKTKIVLPGKNDEVELEWAPKGQKDTIDKYLKTLPPEALPVKGSQAAQERKQLLQKQIPVHDIDPTLCHELNEEEIKKMEEYIAHIKKSSVGVGQIVNLSSVIKANLHNISPQEAHIIASRYSKGIPFSEILKLQAGLAQNLENLTLNNSKNIKNIPTLPVMQPGKLHGSVQEENVQNTVPSVKFKDITHPWYTQSNPSKNPLNPQYAENFKVKQLKGQNAQRPVDDSQSAVDEKLLQGTNFDPSKTPSQFLGYHTPGFRPGHYGIQSLSDQVLDPSNPEKKLYNNKQLEASKDDLSSKPVPCGNVSFEAARGIKPNFSQNLQGSRKKHPTDQCGFENPYFNQNRQDPKHLAAHKSTPGYSIFAESHDSKSPKNVKDLIYSTYDPNRGPIPQNQNENTFDNKNVNPGISSYNPNAVFNTYKHDPSIFNQQKEKNNSALLLGGEQPSNLLYNKEGLYSNHGLGNFNPATTTEDKNSDRERSVPAYNPENSGSKHGLRKFDPITGKYLLESHRYPDIVKSDPDQTYDPTIDKSIKDDRIPEITENQYPHNWGSSKPLNRQTLPKFDVSTGKYIPEDHLFPESNVPRYPYDSDRSLFDPETGKYTAVPRDYNRRNVNDNSKPNTLGQDGSKFDPNSGKYIPDHLLTESGACQYPYGSDKNLYDPNEYAAMFDNVKANTLQSLPKFEPITGKYIPENNLSPEYTSYPYGSDKMIFDPETGKYLALPSDSFEPNKLQSHSNYSPNKIRKPPSALQAGHINVPEDYLEPHMVNIGAIQDINPEIRAATAELNPGYDKESLYGDSEAEYSPESIREIMNNIKLPDCHYCKKPFDENEFAVTIDRANVLFHAPCFKCAGCNQSLADNIYFYHKETNNVYCGRDYAKIKGYPRCSACDELIFTKEYCLAENSTFHLKHFCCFQCDIPLAGQDYTLEDEKPYCLPCYESSKAAKCSTCEKVIKPDEIGCQLNGVHFHAEDRCFRCIVCSIPLMGKKLLLRNEKLYCSHECFNTVKK